MQNPMHQFLIKELIPLHLGGYNISFTNSSLLMVIATTLIIAIQFFGLRGQTLIPSKLQAFYEISYEFVTGLAKDNAGSDAKKYFPFIFSLFMFVLFGNLLGMLPYSFTFTSHIIVTFALAFMVFLTVTAVGFGRHGLGYFKLLCPHGVPLAAAPLVILIELISYLMRPITLALRLFVNMMSGHMILKLFGTFTVMMGVWGAVPLAFIIGMTAFEFFIAGLQAYVFTILTCVYLNDALHLH
ncbi:MAG: F0F1 ATP synthase subunit A [Alphaproteobacteria bacterium]|jgi:F-type H+-transporting ATPase subunit a|nr:F0F1 ATP synthase subunit A [Alphaproteobacteria bacterium]